MMVKRLIKAFKQSDYSKHETKRSVLKRFLILFGIFSAYLVLMSFEYGVENGVLVALLTWSFFVFCTPIADAGFLIDFPVRLLTKVRMLYSEIMVWTIAALLNSYCLFANPAIYEKTPILSLFKNILTHPVPFWSIIAISAVGTFFSVYFGDELMDVRHHHEKEKSKKHGKKHRMVIVAFIAVATILLYYYLINQFGLSI